jgi:hypothetical protein
VKEILKELCRSVFDFNFYEKKLDLNGIAGLAVTAPLGPMSSVRAGAPAAAAAVSFEGER